MSHDAPQVEVKSRAQLRRWLEKNHAKSKGIWLVSYKKAVPKHYLPYDDIVEEVLCFGWIDSLPRKLDAERSQLYLCPRKKGSPWSRVNKQRVKKLLKAKLMAPAGQALIDRARGDGTWTILDDVEDLVIPPDLKRALSANKTAQKFFEAFPPSAKKGILWWIKSAKTDATREKRIATTVAKAAENQRAQG